MHYIIDLFRVLRGSIYLNTGNEISNTVMLASVPRSGSTWISNVINHKNEYRYVFEPFFPKYVRAFKSFKYRQYISVHDDDPVLIGKARHVVSGKIRNFWVDRFNKKIICEKRLIKDVRINLLLKWLKHHFQELRIVLLLRHPFAVAHSRMKIGWDAHLDLYMNQADLVSDLLHPFIDEIKKCTTDFEKQVCAWCIENYVPLTQFKGSDDIYIAFYEKFCVDAVHETKSLLRWLGHEDLTISRDAVRRPSEMTKKHSSNLSGSELIQQWKKKIPDETIIKGVHILEVFGLSKIYDSNVMPKQ